MRLPTNHELPTMQRLALALLLFAFVGSTADAQHWQEHHGEDDDADAAQPLQQGAPELDARRQHIDIGEDGGSRGGDARASRASRHSIADTSTFDRDRRSREAFHPSSDPASKETDDSENV